MEANILGRAEEKKILKECAASHRSELVAVYGRRRVGKTYLMRELFSDRMAFSFTGIYNETKKVQLHQFSIALSNTFKKDCGPFTSWYEAFDALKACLLELHDETVMVFLDELPWMETKKSDLLNAFSYFWNNWDSEKTSLKLFVCGSATTWMIDKLIGNKGGLYGRVTRSVYLAPFTLYETETYLREYKKFTLSRMQVLDIYMILGGIPYYLDMLDASLPVSVNIDRLFFGKNAPLRFEFDFLYRSLFKDSSIYREIIKTLAGRLSGMTRKDLVKNSHLTDNGCLTEALKNLISCDFIQKYTTIGKKEHDAVYRLTDMFSLFYLQFVSSDNGQDENLWSNSVNSGKINAWKGHTFETVCLCHIKQIKKSLGISGILSNIYSWSCKPYIDTDGVEWAGGQIDLLIDRKDDVIDIAEIKYSCDEYIITGKYEEEIRKRTELFRHVTKTKKALHTIFITTYGVKKSNHSGIVQSEIVLDDLFG